MQPITERITYSKCAIMHRRSFANRMPILTAVTVLTAVAFFQPGPAALRGIFEEGLERRRTEYGVFDARTAQAARDLGMFLSRHGEEADARNVLDQVVRIDENVFRPADSRTLADVAELAAVSPAIQAEALWKRGPNLRYPMWRRGLWRNWADCGRSRTIGRGRRRSTAARWPRKRRQWQEQRGRGPRPERAGKIGGRRRSDPAARSRPGH